MMRGMGIGNIGYGLFRPEWLVILVFAGVIVYLVSSLNRNINKHPGGNDLMQVLSDRYANGFTSAEQYSEIKVLLENTLTADPALLHIMERLVYGEIDIIQYIRIKDNLLAVKSSCLDTNKLKLRYAQGDLSEEQFRQIHGK